MSNTEHLKIKPYARLLTMLGDQLIKDETIALIELVKNAHDADAEHVKISFQGFKADYTSTNQSKIVIEDDGNGMNDNILKNAWMNPATPEKLKRKQEKNKTDKGRIMQGEKGIGRFAIFKLGKKIEIITRRQKQLDDHFVDAPESDNEYILNYDFTSYDTDFLEQNGEKKDIFLDDLSASLDVREAERIRSTEKTVNGTAINRKPYGTIIEISGLNAKWNQNKIAKVYQNILRMQPIFGEEFISNFSVSVDINGTPYTSSKQGPETIQNLLNNKAVLKVKGNYDEKKSRIVFSMDGYFGKEEYSFDLESPEMQGIKPMKDFFDALKDREVECGAFRYVFYVFDLNISVEDKNTKYHLNDGEKDIIKAHRIYLYRDGIRVMPYGDPEDDWIKLDTIRGTEGAGRILGNDQIVGYIQISQENNPKLRDKTNREGLVEDGYAREDLINICQLILRYIRGRQYKRYLIDKKRIKEKREENQNRPLGLIKKARDEQIVNNAVEKVLSRVSTVRLSEIPKEDIAAGQEFVNKFLDNLEISYRKERDVYENRISTTENLAAIGLSAETAYHDARIILQEINHKLGDVINQYKDTPGANLNKQSVIEDLEPIKKRSDNVMELMRNIQRLFPSTKNKKGNVDVQQTVHMVRDLYAKSLKDADIECIINSRTNRQFVIECTDAVLLQVFINLFDNSLYWLKTVKRKRCITIEFNTTEKTIVFADSGPGVIEGDIPYIFEAFYSGKGEDGKGLGLYIAKQLLARYEGNIALLTERGDKILDGANFLIRFHSEEA